MSTDLVTQGIWPKLTKAVRRSRQPCAVAVAYFGKGATQLLPLPKGSCLVVDASERTVSSGQTCPAELSKAIKRGIRVYSVANLHAKVFVLGRTAYIGSANASKRSATQLVEAVVRTTEPGAVRAAKMFVRDHCLHELTPGVIKRLAKLYRPPVVPGGGRDQDAGKDTSHQPLLPKLLLAQLRLVDWSERDQALHDAALKTAMKRREHPRSFQLESFRHAGKCPYRRGDLVIQITDEGGGHVLVTPPGNVLHVRTHRGKYRPMSFVYLERPARRRRSLKALSGSLGRGAPKRLRQEGVIRDLKFAQALLQSFAS